MACMSRIDRNLRSKAFVYLMEFCCVSVDIWDGARSGSWEGMMELAEVWMLLITPPYTCNETRCSILGLRDYIVLPLSLEIVTISPPPPKYIHQWL